MCLCGPQNTYVENVFFQQTYKVYVCTVLHTYAPRLAPEITG